MPHRYEAEHAVRLSQGVPLRVIREKQRFLRERHQGMAR
jgi:hypothetical protein